MNTVSQAQLPVYAILRTRMCWVRTSLVVVAGVIAALVVATSLTRFTNLAKKAPAMISNQVPSIVVGGILALAVVACIRLLMAA